MFRFFINLFLWNKQPMDQTFYSDVQAISHWDPTSRIAQLTNLGSGINLDVAWILF